MPRLESLRLILRPPEYSDAPAISALIGDYAVAKNLATAPYPYGEKDAQDYVSRAAMARVAGEGFVFAILYREDQAFLGCCGLHLRDGYFELGYWIGRPYWGMGIATEAAERMIAFAFDSLKADRLTAGHFEDNPLSGRVLSKLGFVATGTEMQPSRARGRAVLAHRMALTKADFGRKKAA